MGILGTAELRDFYAGYIAAWNRRDMERYYSLYSEDLVFRDGMEVLQGVNALRQRYDADLAGLPDLTMECVRLLVDAEAQTLAAENIERGTHTGDLMVGGTMLPPTGKAIELRGGLFLTLDAEGRIAEISEYIDPGQFFAQLSNRDPG